MTAFPPIAAIHAPFQTHLNNEPYPHSAIGAAAAALLNVRSTSPFQSGCGEWLRSRPVSPGLLTMLPAALKIVC